MVNSNSRRKIKFVHYRLSMNANSTITVSARFLFIWFKCATFTSINDALAYIYEEEQVDEIEIKEKSNLIRVKKRNG